MKLSAFKNASSTEASPSVETPREPSWRFAQSNRIRGIEKVGMLAMLCTYRVCKTSSEIAGTEIVFNLAGFSRGPKYVRKPKSAKTNVEGIRQILQAARRVGVGRAEDSRSFGTDRSLVRVP
jgi:hypothetical protein